MFGDHQQLSMVRAKYPSRLLRLRSVPVRAKRCTPRAQARAKQCSCMLPLRSVPVRAKRRTPRAQARAKQCSRMPGTKTTPEVLEDQITICE
jgi:hypothetical protein